MKATNNHQKRHITTTGLHLSDKEIKEIFLIETTRMLILGEVDRKIGIRKKHDGMSGVLTKFLQG